MIEEDFDTLTYLDSMIPILNNDKFMANNLAEIRAIKNGIRFNMLDSKEDLLEMMSLVKRIFTIDNYELKSLIFNKFEYLGFKPKEIKVNKDLSTRQATICFTSNYMALYMTSEETILEIIDSLKKSI